MKAFLKKAISSFGYELRRVHPTYPMQAFDLLNQIRDDPALDSEMQSFLRFALINLSESRSQIFQDLFVIFKLGKRRDGYFVEFGAADGVFLSNSLLLESRYGWGGIVAEPSKGWHRDLQSNRKCIVDLRCVWSETGKKLIFLEAQEPVLSTVSTFQAADGHDRSSSKKYPVETVSLNDLLEQHNAPHEIDYLSIDTEGSELTILESFNFKRRPVRIITVEHNYGRQRKEIFSLLTSKGYERHWENITMWDDWYVLREAVR